MLSSLILSLAVSTSPVTIEENNLAVDNVAVRPGKIRIAVRPGKIRIEAKKAAVRPGKIRIDAKKTAVRPGKIRI